MEGSGSEGRRYSGDEQPIKVGNEHLDLLDALHAALDERGGRRLFTINTIAHLVDPDDPRTTQETRRQATAMVDVLLDAGLLHQEGYLKIGGDHLPAYATGPSLSDLELLDEAKP